MAKPELGLKRICVACAARFYDLTKSPAECPKCGAVQPLDQPRLRRAGGHMLDDRRPKKVAAAEDTDTDAEVEVADDEAEEGVLEDTSDLEDDGDAIGADLEVESDGDEPER